MFKIWLAIALLALAAPVSAQYGIWSATMTAELLYADEDLGFKQVGYRPRSPNGSPNGSLTNDMFVFQGAIYTITAVEQFTGTDYPMFRPDGSITLKFVPSLTTESDLARMSLSANDEILTIDYYQHTSTGVSIQFAAPDWRWTPGQEIALVLTRLPLVPAAVEAQAELHRNAITVCGLLAGFAMASAYTSNRRRRSAAARLSTACLYVSAMAFLTVVCVSAIYLIAFMHYRQLTTVDPSITDKVLSAGTFYYLYSVNLFTGLGGMVALLVAIGSSGFVQSNVQGSLTTLLALLAFGAMVFSVVIVLMSPLSPF